MSSGLSFVVDLVIVTLLVLTIVFAAVLNRRLMAWRQDRAQFERLIAEFNQAAARAEAGVERLKAASEQTGKSLQQAVTKGQSLRDDLSYLIERAEPLVDRLNDGVRNRRNPPRDDMPASPASALAEKVEAIERATDAGDERGRAKRELLRALAALR
jgi:septal ring factor EnvC (AmiA/AmiB activator)